ncbi:hypothetical protein QQ020_21790 [Fulvivirgaceae bacterium BMA12]|uniref:Uncharacterized protein n=1 Tax=Agaribacillus aureus TaxID=3051825 RepID=A0ABT8LBZ8_9BACT|nr:hypothetical protein [Fulvivirgaceae bacterium BMA12]
MKITLTIILTVLTFQCSIGQVAIIQDPDGWTNVRKEPNGQSKIIHKIYENEVFWYDDETTDHQKDWISIYIPKNDYCLGKSEPPYLAGFIHKSRLLPLEKLDPCKGKAFSFKYVLSEFNPTNRIIDKQDGKWITQIDGRPVWGTDGNLPKIQVDDIVVEIDGQLLIINKVFYADLYECNHAFSVYKNGEIYFVHQWNSDGAGAYEIVWVLEKNRLRQRLVGSVI